MVTKEQAMTAQMFHYGKCTRTLGPQGAVKEHSECWRRNGATQTWATRPDQFRVPIKYGLKTCGQLWHNDADQFHTADDCPLCDPKYVTKDLRTEQYKRSVELTSEEVKH